MLVLVFVSTFDQQVENLYFDGLGCNQAQEAAVFDLVFYFLISNFIYLRHGNSGLCCNSCIDLC